MLDRLIPSDGMGSMDYPDHHPYIVMGYLSNEQQERLRDLVKRMNSAESVTNPLINGDGYRWTDADLYDHIMQDAVKDFDAVFNRFVSRLDKKMKENF